MLELFRSWKRYFDSFTAEVDGSQGTFHHQSCRDCHYHEQRDAKTKRKPVLRYASYIIIIINVIDSYLNHPLPLYFIMGFKA